MKPEEVEALRQAVSDLRRDIEQRFGKHPSSEDQPPDASGPADQAGEGLRARLERFGVGELYRGLRNAATVFGMLGMREHAVEVDAFGMDPFYLDDARVLLDFFYDRWWRVQVSGGEHLAQPGPVIFVANRSGILPYDGLMIAHAAERISPSAQRPRFLVADWIATLPFFQPRIARLGGVRACPENAERLLRDGQRIVVFPEGKKGALKPFSERYRLQRFARGGFVSLALRLNATVIPTAVVGAEEAHPVLFRPVFPSRLLGMPIPITPTFPLLGPLGLIPLPSQWRICFGEPIRWTQNDRRRADDALFINRTRDRIRSTIQLRLEEEIRRRSGVFNA
jgi:1-acyl-sn-glycerol-3-phosphate acyltransferase